MTNMRLTTITLSLLIITAACSDEVVVEKKQINWKDNQDPTHILVTVEGLSEPEAVRYDEQLDVYFISNFNGGGNERDANGFISKVSADGTMEELKFMVGTSDSPLHAPRGMYITGDALWVADIDGIHAFNKETGRHVEFLNFRQFNPGFLNDISIDANGDLFVTDTGNSGGLFKVSGKTVTVASDSMPYRPNGITYEAINQILLVAPWGGSQDFYSWDSEAETFNLFGTANGGGNFDGIEFVEGALLSASQVDSSLHLMESGSDRILIKTTGRPADIAVDTKRLRVAVPYIALDKVDIWALTNDSNSN